MSMKSILLRISPVLIALFIVCVPLVADYSYASAPTLQVNVVRAADDAAASKEISPAACDGWISCLTSLPKRLFQYGMSAIGAALVYIATLILSMAALLFDWLITHTVIQFGALYGTIKVAVETAWTAFRDIANILIIGIFTFVAISIILGLKEFGQKKMVANVLIVAVLINFSLLGTKMVIDASNYVAGQIYNAAQLGGTNANATTGGATAQYGIADQFMYLLGVQTAAKTWKTVSDTALAKDSGWAALGHGILLTFVLLGAAVVLFYGSFLLVSRMIMLIFLLITSAIAVGSYLIPDWAGSSYGWTAWKSSLIWCTAFAPIIMILLWVTLNVSYAMKGTYKATLGAALSDPAGGSNTEAIFMYLLVLGMLYATFSISSKWSSKIGGFNMAQIAALAPLTLGSRLAAFGLRQTAGWAGYKIDKGLTGEAKAARDRAGEARMKQQAALNRGDTLWAKRYGAVAGKFESLSATKEQQAALARKVAESKMNLMNTAPVKATLGAIGIKGLAAGESAAGAKSYSDQIKTRAEAAEKAAAKIAPSKEQNEATKEKVREERRDRKEMLEATKRTAEQTAESQRKPIEELVKATKDSRNDAIKTREANQETLNTQVKQVREAAAQHDQGYDLDQKAIQKDEEEKAAIIAQHTGSERDDLLRTQADRISNARQRVQQFESTQIPQIATLMTAKTAQYQTDHRAVETAERDIEKLNKQLASVEAPVKEAAQALKEFNDETEKIATAKVTAIGESAENIAQKIGQKQGPPLARLIGKYSGANEWVGDQAQSMYKKKMKTSDLAAVMKDLQDSNK